ncbi:MAG: hypothetical protein M1812_006290 [Candelaria pacifica]|nr:MAG: hypothetical protein M1812_006290 [Candelaria pacifica]
MGGGSYRKIFSVVLVLSLVFPVTTQVNITFRGPRDVTEVFAERDMVQTCQGITPGICCVPIYRNVASSIDFEPTEVEVTGLPEHTMAHTYQREGEHTYCDGLVVGWGSGPNEWHSGPFTLPLTGASWQPSTQFHAAKDFKYPDIIEIMDSPGVWGAPWTESGRGDGRYFNHQGQYMRFSPPNFPHADGSTQRTREGYCLTDAECSSSNCDPLTLKDRAILFGIQTLSETIGSCTS